MSDSQKDIHKKLLGKQGEDAVADYLKNIGYNLIKRNYRTRYGEVDIIAEKDDTLYFVEVKTRTNNLFGRPCEAVDYKKIEKYRKLATGFIQIYGEKNISFAVAEVTPDGINLIENAF